MTDVEQQEAAENEYFGSLKLPTNPNYDFDLDNDGIDYVNPVTANDKLALYTNAVIDLGARQVRMGRKLERVRLERLEWEEKLSDFKRMLLARHPAPAAATKNLQLTEAYILSVMASDLETEYFEQAEREVRKYDRQIGKIKSELEACKTTFETLKVAATNITVHLSYVKAEEKAGRR